MPISFADCSTTDQMDQSVSMSPLIFPPLRTGSKSRPSLIDAAAIQTSIALSTQIGIATVRTLPPLPRRSQMTHRPSRC
jgi:hypothetical protein